MDTEQVVMIAPDKILADENIRFGLKKDKVTALAEAIQAIGYVTTPLWVEPLETPIDGCEYRLTAGNYRRAAVEELNKNAAGLLLPCLVRTISNPLQRLKTQLSENGDRENMSPMDSAIAIKKLLDNGLPKVEVRKLFPRNGGRNGNKVQPCSNAWLNMMLNFLDFPKPIQGKIHAGESGGGIGVATAYELWKEKLKPGFTPQKWSTILAEAENDRVAQVDREEGDEKRFLESVRKEEEAKQKTEAVKKELEDTKAKLTEAAKEVDARNEKAAELYKQAKKKIADAAERKAAEDALKAAEAEAKEAEKAAQDLKKNLEKLETKVESQEKKLAAKDTKKKPAKTSLKKAPTPTDIKKAAAKAEGTTVPLKAPEMRECIHELTLPGMLPKVQEIGNILMRAFNSVLTYHQAGAEIAYSVTKELKERPKHMSAVPDEEPVVVPSAKKK